MSVFQCGFAAIVSRLINCGVLSCVQSSEGKNIYIYDAASFCKGLQQHLKNAIS